MIHTAVVKNFKNDCISMKNLKFVFINLILIDHQIKCCLINDYYCTNFDDKLSWHDNDR